MLKYKTVPKISFFEKYQIEKLSLMISLFFVLLANKNFWNALLASQSKSFLSLTLLILSTVVGLMSIQWVVFLIIFNRWTIKPLGTVLFVLTSFAVYFMNQYGVFLDKEMLRNLIQTDFKEALDLLDWRMFSYLLLMGILPSVLLMRVEIHLISLKIAIFRRFVFIFLAVIVSLGSLWIISPTMIPLMRKHNKMRYLITPQNYLISLARVLSFRVSTLQKSRTIIGGDAHSISDPKKNPIAFVLIVGETVRSANWGLSDYDRQTTPNLSKYDVINFKNFTSCGTDTATSLPCMFSTYGRYSYNEDQIRGSDSFLHIFARSNISILWRDNQSGSKGVADNLPSENLEQFDNPSLITPSGHRYDEVLLTMLSEKVLEHKDHVLIVLHMLGNHGPAYFQRYPLSFRKWKPTCDSTRINDCSHESLINTYDNAILYTDYVVSKAIDLLKDIKGYDVGLIYVSDHGESLGERGLYLHGFPYAIAPKEQTSVPFVLWLSQSLKQRSGLTQECLLNEANRHASHDNLSHTLIGLFEVETKAYNQSLDILSSCRKNVSVYITNENR